MARTGITKQEVYKAATIIAKRHQIPSITELRKLLGRGSTTTIHKYFKSWKQECYQKGSNANGIDLITYNRITEEINLVKQALVKQTSKNEELAAQLIQTEQKLTQLKETHQILNIEFNVVKEQNLQLAAEKEKYQMALEHVVSERDQVLATVLNQQNQLIDSLRQELKEVNQTSIEQIKELGRKGDDALIEEKVKSINLQDEVSQQKNIIDELREQFLKSQETIKLLKKEIERQRKFTQEVVNVAPVLQSEALTLQLEE
jgi:chromosome segregation ATPase